VAPDERWWSELAKVRRLTTNGLGERTATIRVLRTAVHNHNGQGRFAFLHRHLPLAER